jgi:hypothetical protein
MARPYLPLMLALGLSFSTTMALAEDMQPAAASPLSGITFEDQPMTLPVTESFQTAMHDIASDIGKHCGATEAYGWRLLQTEQQRVNNAFNASVSKFNEHGYVLTPQTPRSATKEVTVFTAQKTDKNILVMWSAGELGLVLLLCDAQNGVVAHTDEVAQPDVTIIPDEMVTPPKKTTKPVAKKPVAKTKIKPVVKKTTKAAHKVSPKATPQKHEPMTPEVKAMLESLPDVVPVPDMPDAIRVAAPKADDMPVIQEKVVPPAPIVPEAPAAPAAVIPEPPMGGLAPNMPLPTPPAQIPDMPAPPQSDMPKSGMMVVPPTQQ